MFCFVVRQALQVDVYDEDLLPGTTQEDDDLLGRVDVVLEGELTIDQPIRRWFTLTELGEGCTVCTHSQGAVSQQELTTIFVHAWFSSCLRRAFTRCCAQWTTRF